MGQSTPGIDSIGGLIALQDGGNQEEDAGDEGGEGQRLRPGGRLRGEDESGQDPPRRARTRWLSWSSSRGSWRLSWTSPPSACPSPPCSWKRRRSSSPPLSSR